MSTVAPSLKPSTVYRRLMERLPVRTPRRTIVNMQFNAAQEALWEIVAPALDEQRALRVIVLKARRVGISSFIENLLTCTCFFQDYTNGMIIAHQDEPGERIWEMSRLFVEGSPLKVRARFQGQRLQFRHSKLELTTAGSPEATRSSDLTVAHLSEVAFWPRRGQKALLSIQQCLPREASAFSMLFIESTANGMVSDGAMFYELWREAVAGTSEYVPFFFPWHKFPGYTMPEALPIEDVSETEDRLKADLNLTWGQLRWRRLVMARDCRNDENLFNQEYPSTPEMAFIVSGLPFFAPSKLFWIEHYIEDGIKGQLTMREDKITFERVPHGPLSIYRPPRAGHQYVIGADSAMGIASDKASKSAAVVLDMETLEQVAEYEAPSAPHVFAKDLAMLGRMYNHALIAPEVQHSGGGGGKEMLQFLMRSWHYYYIHRRQLPDHIQMTREPIYGWETNHVTRPRMVSRIQEVIDEKSGVIHSRNLLMQLSHFGHNDSGRLEALAGHDDVLFAYGIALVSRSENYVAKSISVQTQEPERIDVEAAGRRVQEPWETTISVQQDLLLADREMQEAKDFLSW